MLLQTNEHSVAAIPPPVMDGEPDNTAPIAAIQAVAGLRSYWRNRWMVLVKAPLTLMASLPALTVYLITDQTSSLPLLLAFVVATVATGCGAAVFNQLLEADLDARMTRTLGRPIPAGELSRRTAFIVGLLLSLAGPVLLLVLFPPIAAILAILTVGWYVLLYTPLKTKTVWCTEVGAVSGAIPPLIGAAATGSLALPIGWTVAAILAIWQIPHFHPIAWRYREDYRRAGLRMLAAVDPSGRRAANHSLVYALVLLPVSLTPLLAGAGAVYVLLMFPAGLAFAFLTLRFRRLEGRDAAARVLFRFSLVYIALLLLAILIDPGLSTRAGL